MRKDILMVTLRFLMQVLTSHMAKSCEKEGGFHMMGSLAKVLVEDLSYKTLMVKQLANSLQLEKYIFPIFSSCGYLQVRSNTSIDGECMCLLKYLSML
jgi:hypothetical protein